MLTVLTQMPFYFNQSRMTALEQDPTEPAYALLKNRRI
jgi:hypothetical protein